jgi:hypothetical protein
VGKARISVKLSDLNDRRQRQQAPPPGSARPTAADSLNVSSRKTLELAKAGDRWVIVKESTGA